MANCAASTNVQKPTGMRWEGKPATLFLKVSPQNVAMRTMIGPGTRRGYRSNGG
jgi:hypothetical protein